MVGQGRKEEAVRLMRQEPRRMYPLTTQKSSVKSNVCFDFCDFSYDLQGMEGTLVFAYLSGCRSRGMGQQGMPLLHWRIVHAVSPLQCVLKPLVAWTTKVDSLFLDFLGCFMPYVDAVSIFFLSAGGFAQDI